MSEEKKIRAMTIKRFVNAKLSGKTTAEGFLSAHRDFLLNHTFLAPVLEAYDNGEMLPTPTIQACQQVLFDHMVASDAAKAKAATDAKAAKANTVIRKGDKVIKSSVPSKEYTVTLMVKVYDRNGENVKIEVGTVERKKFREVKKAGQTILEPYTEITPAVWGAETFNEASRLADRRLFDRGDSVYAEIVNTQGVPIKTTIQRDDAIARTMKQPKGPASRVKGSSTKTLKWVGKAKNDRSSFSRG